MRIRQFYIGIILKQNKIAEDAVGKSYDDIHNTLTILFEKSKIVSFASSIMKKKCVSYSI